MAGGESPRQKMINMMYIVLIAMLALNVDTKVLLKFIKINQAFETTNAEKIVDNTNKVESIRAAVDDSGNRKEDLDVLSLSEVVRKKADSIISYMGDIKNTVIEETGGVDKKYGIKGYKNIDFVYGYFGVNENTQEGRGATLQNVLNGFSSFVLDSIFDGDKSSGVHNLAQNADEIPLYQNDPPKQPEFWNINFGYGTSAGAGLATISQLQADVINLETKALNKLGAAVGAADLKFDLVTLTDLPEQKVVAAGATYRTQLFLSAASSAIVPIMTADGDTLEVTNGRGLYEFTAQGGGYNSEGLAEKQYVGSISVILPGGSDTTFIDTVTYFVARPVIQIQSQSVQALYLNCGNDIQVNVPALGSEYNPRFSAEGGDVIRGNRPGEITIVPKVNTTVSLKVSNAGNLLGTENFRVRTIPAPEIIATKGAGCRRNEQNCGTIINVDRGITMADATINMDVIADESFAKFLPNDSRFQVRQADVLLVRNGQALGSPVRVTGRSINLNQRFPNRRSGDNLRIKVTRVARSNFRGEAEAFANFSQNPLMVPIN